MPKEDLLKNSKEISSQADLVFIKCGDAWIDFIKKAGKKIIQSEEYNEARAEMSKRINNAINKLSQEEENIIFEVKENDPYKRSHFDAYLDERIAKFMLSEKKTPSEYSALFQYIIDRPYWSDFFEKFKEGN